MDKDKLIHDMEINMSGDNASGFDRVNYQTLNIVGKREKSR
jgi:hypothetical protein